MSHTTLHSLVVTEVRALTPAIRAVRLAAADHSALPDWQAGAHINIALPDGSERSYSLVNGQATSAATHAPKSYLIGVRLSENSTGGSRFVHSLTVGDRVDASAPRNHFALAASAHEIVLVAGGIGITPLVAMAAELQAAQRRFRLVYAVRNRDQLAFLDEVQALAGEGLSVHCDAEAGQFDLAGLMASLVHGEPLYLCGPMPMIQAGIAAAKQLGWAEDRLHFEIFSAPDALAGDKPFEVVLKSSGKRYLVPADKTILDVLVAAGHDPIYDCQRGDCGICQVGVVEGVPDHRDFILSDSEKAAGRLIQICISRAHSNELVLDL
jgi:vanillate O-demethylase ferredoxin subunit